MNFCDRCKCPIIVGKHIDPFACISTLRQKVEADELERARLKKEVKRLERKVRSAQAIASMRNVR